MKPLLSVCIPTYNRENELFELIEILLKVRRDDLEIVITDNCSTDQTRQVVSHYEDRRLRYCCNNEPIPALQNVIHSIFNGTGKYVLYCNDRDLLFAERIEKLMNVLSENDFSFLHSPRYSSADRMSLHIYEKGYESLIHQKCIHHPTGMVFNRDLISQHLNEADYERFVPFVYTYDFLMLDLIQYEKSAIFDYGYWSARPMSYLRNHRAGTGPNLYFLPQTREKIFYKVFEHVFKTLDYGMTDNQKVHLAESIYQYFAILFCSYKLVMSDVDETEHYGLKTKKISTLEMLYICDAFFERSVAVMSNSEYSSDFVSSVKRNKLKFLAGVIESCAKIDILNVIKLFRRMRNCEKI